MKDQIADESAFALTDEHVASGGFHAGTNRLFDSGLGDCRTAFVSLPLADERDNARDVGCDC